MRADNCGQIADILILKHRKVTVIRILKNICIANLILFIVSCVSYKKKVIPLVNSVPPFGGTIFLDHDIITDSDNTTFVSLS